MNNIDGMGQRECNEAGVEDVIFKTFASLIYFLENELLFRCFCHAFCSKNLTSFKRI